MPPKSINKKPTNQIAVLAKMRADEVERVRKENELIELEQKRIFEEEERIRLEEEEKRKSILEERRLKKEAKVLKQKSEGTFKSKAEKEKIKRAEASRMRLIETNTKLAAYESEDEEESDEESDDEEEEEKLRSPIICVMGHVDNGKTKLLDYIRNSNVQEKEASGITQQIGASFKSKEYLKNQKDIKVPGMLFIDTPGHESFKGLRKRGIDICDVVILVIDIMKAKLEQQTIECIKLCNSNDIPFIIALNKVDRIDGYEEKTKDGIDNFNHLKKTLFKDIWKLNINPVMYDENYDTVDEPVICVPVSAMTGYNVDELLYRVVMYCQNVLTNKIIIYNNFKCMIMESKKNNDNESSLDVILIDGTLSVGDIIGLTKNNQNFVTKIKTILLPNEDQEMRVTNSYTHVKSVQGSCGVKILAKGLEDISLGPLFKLEDEDEYFETFKYNFETDDEGIAVFTETQGQMEDYLYHLKSLNIKVKIAVIGSVNKKNIFLMESFKDKFKHILCFNVKINKEATDFIKENKIMVHSSDTIYKLTDMYLNVANKIKEQQLIDLKQKAVIPFELTINKCFNQTNPIILDVSVKFEISLGVELCNDNGVLIGKVTGIRHNNKDMKSAKDSNISISIDSTKTYNRDIKTSKLYPKTSRESLDLLKEHFRELITREMMPVIKKIKETQSIA